MTKLSSQLLRFTSDVPSTSSVSSFTTTLPFSEWKDKADLGYWMGLIFLCMKSKLRIFVTFEGRKMAWHLKRFAVFLLPSPLQPYLSTPLSCATFPSSRKPDSGSKLAHLDALRGLACLVVINQHFTTALSTAIYIAYGGPCIGPVCPIPNNYIIQLPYVNLLWNGHAMVAVFFVISGQVLSHSTLKHAHSLNRLSTNELAITHSKSLLGLASSIFRRTFRLYLPIVVSTLLVALTSYAGLFAAAKHNQDIYWMTLLTSEEPTPDRFETLSGQLDQWIRFLVAQVREGARNELDRHTWTIPVEWHSSMVLFLVLAALCRMHLRWRTLWILLLIVYAAYFVHESDLLFLCGMWIADYNLELDSSNNDNANETFRKYTSGQPEAMELLNCITDEENKQFHDGSGGDSYACRDISYHDRLMGLYCYLPHTSTILHAVLFLAAGYLMSFPYEQPNNTTGYRLLASLAPNQWQNKPLYKNVGAVLLVWTVERCSIVRRALSGRVVQYIGKLSFSLYLVHGPVIRSLGYVIIPPVKLFVNAQESMAGFCASWLICALVVGLVTWWFADLFHRVVDEPCVRLGRWIEQKCID